jgi:hypothetical protein
VEGTPFGSNSIPASLLHKCFAQVDLYQSDNRKVCIMGVWTPQVINSDYDPSITNSELALRPIRSSKRNGKHWRLNGTLLLTRSLSLRTPYSWQYAQPEKPWSYAGIAVKAKSRAVQSRRIRRYCPVNLSEPDLTLHRDELMHIIDLHQVEQGAIKLMPSVSSGGLARLIRTKMFFKKK